MSKEQMISEARQLFERLQAGDTAEYGDAKFMANRILSQLERAGVDASALDPAGKKSAVQEAVKKQTINEARQLFERLRAGDTAEHGGVEIMANYILSKLGRAGMDASALDRKDDEKSADEIETFLRKAEKDAAKKVGRSL